MFAGDVVIFGKGTVPQLAVEAERTRYETASNFFDYFQTAVPDE